MHRTCVAHSTLSIIPLCSRSSDSGSGSGNALPGVGLPRRRHVASQTQQRCSVSQVVGLRAPREIESQTDKNTTRQPLPPTRPPANVQLPCQLRLLPTRFVDHLPTASTLSPRTAECRPCVPKFAGTAQHAICRDAQVGEPRAGATGDAEGALVASAYRSSVSLQVSHAGSTATFIAFLVIRVTTLVPDVPVATAIAKGIGPSTTRRNASLLVCLILLS